MKLLLFGLMLLVLSLQIVPTVEAKTLPQTKGASVSKAVASSGIGVYPRLRSDRRALNINFSNLGNAKQVAYMLTYNTQAQNEAAMGGLNLNGSSSQSVELLFGTCSKNVCRYHSGIKDARLEVSYTNLSGKKYLKKYRIKV
jgi:hypothetical protein